MVLPHCRCSLVVDTAVAAVAGDHAEEKQEQDPATEHRAESVFSRRGGAAGYRHRRLTVVVAMAAASRSNIVSSTLCVDGCCPSVAV